MNNELETPKSNVNSTIDAVAGLAKAIPVYQDALQPSAIQVGKALETVTKTVNIALAPIKALVWGYEKIEEFITARVSEKLKNVPPEEIVTPSPQIAGPAVEALRYSGHDENLRELYANLIASAMDKKTLHKAHPAYVDIIKNLASDEAVLLKLFIGNRSFPLIHALSESKVKPNGRVLFYSNFTHLSISLAINHNELLPSYLDNLCRLGLLEIPSDTFLVKEGIYDPLENDEVWNSAKEEFAKSEKSLVFDRGFVRLTAFGKHFIAGVVEDKNDKSN